MNLTANLRDQRGNSPCRALRRAGLVPAVLYGNGKEALALSFGRKDFEDILKAAAGEQFIVNLNIEGGASTQRSAIVKELQKHPLSRAFLHADFYEIDLASKIEMKVPVSVKGKCKGVELGGMLNITRRSLTVRCLPADVPAAIEIDVTNLDLGEALHLLDVALPAGVEFADTSRNFTVVTVAHTEASSSMANAEEEAETAAPGKAGAAPAKAGAAPAKGGK